MTSYDIAESIMSAPIGFDDTDEISISPEYAAALKIARILGIPVNDDLD